MCGTRFQQFHITSSEYILNKASKYVSFNSTQSRWGLISLLITCVQFFIAGFLAFYGLYISFATYYNGDWENMAWWMILIFVLGILSLSVGIFGFLFICWIGAYFIREPIVSTAEIDVKDIKAGIKDIKLRLDNIEEQIKHDATIKIERTSRKLQR